MGLYYLRRLQPCEITFYIIMLRLFLSIVLLPLLQLLTCISIEMFMNNTLQLSTLSQSVHSKSVIMFHTCCEMC